MVSLTTDSMAEPSGGGPGSPAPGQWANIQQVACIFGCKTPHAVYHTPLLPSALNVATLISV